MHVAQINGKPVRLHLDEGIADLSGAVSIGERLLLGNDEGRRLLVCEPGEEGESWRQVGSLALGKRGHEADIEALTYADGYLYALGSHSLRRKSLKPDELSVADNRKRFARIDGQKSRNRLYRIPFDADTGKAGEPESIKLNKRLRKDAFLAPFTQIPGKENGVDIEGLALHRGRLFLGFRGPVLRHNMVPVMVLDFEHPKRYQLRFVELRGHGIRDMVSLGDSLLLLTGPVGDAPGPFRLWWWDGKDQLPGTDRTITPAIRLGNIGVPPGGKAEGLAVLEARADEVELLLVIDGVAQQRALQLSLTIPPRDTAARDPAEGIL